MATASYHARPSIRAGCHVDQSQHFPAALSSGADPLADGAVSSAADVGKGGSSAVKIPRGHREDDSQVLTIELLQCSQRGSTSARAESTAASAPRAHPPGRKPAVKDSLPPPVQSKPPPVVTAAGGGSRQTVDNVGGAAGSRKRAARAGSDATISAARKDTGSPARRAALKAAVDPLDVSQAVASARVSQLSQNGRSTARESKSDESSPVVMPSSSRSSASSGRSSRSSGNTSSGGGDKSPPSTAPRSSAPTPPPAPTAPDAAAEPPPPLTASEAVAVFASRSVRKTLSADDSAASGGQSVGLRAVASGPSGGNRRSRGDGANGAAVCAQSQAGRRTEVASTTTISAAAAPGTKRSGKSAAPQMIPQSASMPDFFSAAAAAAKRAAGAVPVAAAAAKCFGPGQGSGGFLRRGGGSISSSDEEWESDSSQGEPEAEVVEVAEEGGRERARPCAGGGSAEDSYYQRDQLRQQLRRERTRSDSLAAAAAAGGEAAWDSPSQNPPETDPASSNAAATPPSLDSHADCSSSGGGDCDGGGVSWAGHSDCSSQDLLGSAGPWGATERRGAAEVDAAGRSECRRFSLAQLVLATDNFDESNLLGRGAFGQVFKGHLMGCEVAVKRLDGDGWQGPDEYCTELRVLSRVHHPHIVLLMGHCPAAMCLVYEYLPGGDLADYLVGRGNRPEKSASAAGSAAGNGSVAPRPALHWTDRVRILSEVAGALVFLHHSDPPVAHRDLKPHNILLDSSLRTKLADVGLARLIDTSADAGGNITARVRGTAGYIDPEEVVTCEISVLSDVYALGIIMLQLLTGYSNVNQVHKLLASASAAAVSAASGGGSGGGGGMGGMMNDYDMSVGMGGVGGEVIGLSERAKISSSNTTYGTNTSTNSSRRTSNSSNSSSDSGSTSSSGSTTTSSSCSRSGASSPSTPPSTRSQPTDPLSLMADAVAAHLDPSAGAWPLPSARALASLAMRCACRQRRLRPDLASEVHPLLMRLSREAA